MYLLLLSFISLYLRLAEPQSIPLSDLQQGDNATISGFDTVDVPAKFYSIGIVPGTIFKVYRILPLGGAVCIALTETDTKLAVSRSEARIILTHKQR